MRWACARIFARPHGLIAAGNSAHVRSYRLVRIAPTDTVVADLVGASRGATTKARRQALSTRRYAGEWGSAGPSTWADNIPFEQRKTTGGWVSSHTQARLVELGRCGANVAMCAWSGGRVQSHILRDRSDFDPSGRPHISALPAWDRRLGRIHILVDHRKKKERRLSSRTQVC